MTIDAAVRAAQLVGVRFRPQGRHAASGLDCLGLVVVAHGIEAHCVPGNYRLRGPHRDAFLKHASRWFRRVTRCSARPGDVLVIPVAVDQLHLAVKTESGFVHADARLGKVVETPGIPPWPIRAVLRRRKPVMKKEEN